MSDDSPADATEPAMDTAPVVSPDGEEPGRDRRRWWLPALLVLIAIGAGAVLVLLLTGGDDSDKSAKSQVKAAQTLPTAPPVTTTVATPSATAAPTTTAAPAGGGSSGTSAPSPTTPTGPVIASFTSSASTFSCTTGATFAQPTNITLSWSTQNATGVDLSVDGGGLYGSYGPQGSTQLTVPCDGNTHTYKLTAKGSGGQTASKTVSVTTTKN